MIIPSASRLAQIIFGFQEKLGEQIFESFGLIERKLRVVIGPVEIAGYYSNLAGGLTELGIDCDLAVITPHPYSYQSDAKVPWVIRIAIRFGKLIAKSKNHRFIRWPLILLRILVIVPWSVWAMFRYDVFIFGFGRTFMWRNIDLPILKFLGKTTISNLGHGSEARPPYIDGYQSSQDSGTTGGAIALKKMTKATAKRVRFHQKYATVLIGYPMSTSHFATSSFVNFLHLGLPCHFQASQDSYLTKPHIGRKKSGYVRILHAPSNVNAKGTSEIKQVIDGLGLKGHRIEFVLLHGKTNTEVLHEIAQCDFVVDQVYSDTPLAGFATEAAWLGKPAVVAGYGLELVERTMLKDRVPPSEVCRPDELEAAIESLIVSRAKREALGRKAQQFVEENWTREHIADRYLSLIKGEIPESWLCDPNEVLYFYGAGQNQAKSKKQIVSLVQHFGEASLEIERDDLLQGLLCFAGIEKK